MQINKLINKIILFKKMIDFTKLVKDDKRFHSKYDLDRKGRIIFLRMVEKRGEKGLRTRFKGEELADILVENGLVSSIEDGVKEIGKLKGFFALEFPFIPGFQYSLVEYVNIEGETRYSFSRW